MEDRNVIIRRHGVHSYVFVHDRESADLVSPAAARWAADSDLPSFRWFDASVAIQEAIFGSRPDPYLAVFRQAIIRALDRDRAERSETSGSA